MAKIDDQAAAILAAVNDAKAAVGGAVDRVAVDVQFLKDKVASGAGGEIAAADFDAILAGLQGIKDTATAEDPLPENPPVEPPPPTARFRG